ncbi:hypothetical protein [Yinghuangia seranimata]|uniref:hypothetical protein n=1 Tax=Yinghuangia seranimata TaxID=408067 RepID=UPI00248C3E49|nr:hypothetical protein [Yinghuangia seranimata]MDI2129065.1 hypothetical protein [Yinghuangia seranimata]
MSDTIVYVLALDLSADEARVRRAEIVRWLTDQGTLILNPRHVRPRDSGEFLAGPGAEARATDEWLSGGHEADVLCGRDVYSAMESFEPPPCPGCGSQLAVEDHLELLRVWERDGEPTVTCDACRGSAPLGDWESEYGAYVAELAVSFENWPGLKGEFVAELGSRLGGRWRTVMSRY